MRVFAFGYDQDGYDSSKMSRPFQPRLGVFSDDGFSRLDLVVSTAAKYGLRLILPLSNWWDEQGGCQWWVDQVYGRNPKQPKELFFSDPKVKKKMEVLIPPPSTSTSRKQKKEEEKTHHLSLSLSPSLSLSLSQSCLFFNPKQVKDAFQDYIYQVITRKNPRMNGVPYSEEPSIMAWELMNEPQLSNDYDRKAGIPPGSITSAWVWEIAAFIREVDGRRHLVSVGDEGWRSDIKGFGGDWAWINDGTKGIDAATNVYLPEIDFMTLHVYAPNWGFAVDKYHWLLQNLMADRAALAAVANKPIVLEVKRKEVDFFFFFSRLQGNEKKRKSSLSLSLSLSLSVCLRNQNQNRNNNQEFGSPYGYVPDRDAFLSAYTTVAAAFGYAGALIWQVFPWSTPNYQGAAFDFDYTKPGSAAVLALYDVMNAKTLFEKIVASGKSTGLIGK